MKSQNKDKICRFGSIIFNLRYKKKFLKKYKKYQVIIIEGETGSGKTT